MSFKTQLNLGWGIMLGMLILMGLISTLSMRESSQHEKELQETLHHAQQMAFLDQQFRSIQIALTRGVASGELDFESLLASLDRCSAASAELSQLDASTHANPNVEWTALVSFSKSIRLFKLAVEMYLVELEKDPAADHMHQMALNTAIAQERSVQAYLDFTNYTFQRLLTRRHEVLESFRRNQYLSISILGCGFLLSGFIAVFLSRRLNKPIQELLRGIQHLSRGDMDFEMNVDLGGEFGELAKTVDRMRTEIKSRISSQNVLVSRALAAVASERSKAEELGRTNAQLTDEITARESAQQRLKEAFAATKQMEEQLRQTMERAEAANRSKSEFLANMSHELRTPLNHIIGFTELVADKNCGDINPVQEEYLNDVLRAGRHLLSLINDVLDLSKIEAGKMEVDAADVPIRDLLSNSLSMIKEKALKHGIRLSLNIASAPDYVMGDERKLKQVMYNLLSNAAKFTPDGGHIEVGSMIHNGHDCGKRCDDGKSLAVWVRDTGIGIEPQDIERIFAPFEQVESSISRKFHGTGLGLSLTRKIVELHGGRIHAKSEGKGRGTVFEFTLPIDRAHWATS